MKTLKDIITDCAEYMGWSVRFYMGKSEYAEFSKRSPAGEDFSFIVCFDRLSQIPYLVNDYYKSFDIDEHVKMWLDAKANGVADVPGVVELVQDAQYIDNDILQLSSALGGAFSNEDVRKLVLAEDNDEEKTV